MISTRHICTIAVTAICCVVTSMFATRWLAKPVNPGPIRIDAVASVIAEFSNEKPDQFSAVATPFLNRYCIECHSGDAAAGDLALVPLLESQSRSSFPQLWEQAMEALQHGYMPPEEHTAIPSNPELKALKNAFLATTGNPTNANARATIRRLTRNEYENTIRDLFELESTPFDNPQRLVLGDQYFQPKSGRLPDYVMAFSHFEWANRNPSPFSGVPLLPADAPVEHGFDNQAASVSFSPLQLERYIEFTSKLLDHPEFHRSSGLWDKLFVCNKLARADLKATAEQRLATFLPRAFRRFVTARELDRWNEFFLTQLAAQEGFTAAMKTTVQAILISPGFLFRCDAAETSNAYDDWAVASRLSYFLWGSMPDDELLQAARQGRLQNERQVRAQVQRMLADHRCRWLSTSFGVQWLKTMKAIDARPDKQRFPHYYYQRTQTPPGVFMAIEQALLFETILVEDRSIVEFIDADFGYVNRVLMEWYGLQPEATVGFTPGEEDTEDFFRIQWPDRTRGGILSSGATMLSTSATHRTSPVYRGAWFLDVIYHRAPPGPPANVPALTHDHQETRPTNMRQRLAIHRQNANCAACHDKMDPIGFAFEQFDAVGKFRLVDDDGSAVDSVGELSGQTVDGIVELKRAILNHPQMFIRGFVEHLLEFSLGRSLRVADQTTVANVIRNTEQQEYRLGNIIEEVALQIVFPTQRPEVPPVGRVVSLEETNRK